MNQRPWLSRKWQSSGVLALVAALLCVGCSEPRTLDPPSSGTDNSGQASTAPSNRPSMTGGKPSSHAVLPGRLTTSVRNTHLGTGTSVAILFHPRPGRVTLMISGRGMYKACPSDAMGLLPSGSSSSSWSFAWKVSDCIIGEAGKRLELPSPPDAHVGVVLQSQALDITAADLDYFPVDGHSAYRFSGAPPGFTAEVTRTHSAGNTRLYVEDGCLDSWSVTTTVAPGSPIQLTSCGGGNLGQIPADGGAFFSVTGRETVTSPRLGISWP